jgi:hypothetical protein
MDSKLSISYWCFCEHRYDDHNGKFRAIAASIGDDELTNFDVTINDDVEKARWVQNLIIFLFINEWDLDKMVVDIDQIELKTLYQV